MFCFRFRCERQDGGGVWDNLKETAGVMLNRWKPKNSRVVWNCSRWQECCEIGGGAWWERKRGERVRWEWSEASSIRESDCWLAWCCQTHWDQVNPNRGDVMLIVLRQNLGQVRWWQGLGISGYISTGIGGGDSTMRHKGEMRMWEKMRKRQSNVREASERGTNSPIKWDWDEMDIFERRGRGGESEG